MAGISSKAAGGLENKKKYNGIEFDNDLDINTYEAELRDLDPQTGRWWQIDPEIENMEMWSPYASNYDNPILYKDPRGNEGEACCGGFWDAVGDAVNKGMLSLSGAVFGSLNMNTNGLFPTDPFNITPNLTSEEKMWFNNGTQGAMTAAAILPMVKSGEVVPEPGSPKVPISNIEKPTTKLEGKITEPKLPAKTVVKDGSVEVVHYTRSGDHGPPHLHVKGGGAETKVGQNGKPLQGQPELTKAQQAVISENIATVRKTVKQIMKWFNFNSK